jgi:hypothetical protein
MSGYPEQNRLGLERNTGFMTVDGLLQNARPIRSETRATLVGSIARERRGSMNSQLTG